MKGRRLQRAFTLIELLVVIAVIAILAALTFPSLRAAKENGLIARSTSNLRQLATANFSYVADHGTFVPAADSSNNRRWCAQRLSDGTFDARKGFLSPYLGNEQRATPCPLLTQVTGGDQSFEEGSGGYGYNSSYIGGRPGIGRGHYDANGVVVAERPINVTHPARTIMFATTALARADGVQEYPFCEPPFWDFGDGPSGVRPSPSLHFRARGRALVAWCDGHVSAERKEDRPAGSNPYRGEAGAHHLGWLGPDENNGYWNSRQE